MDFQRTLMLQTSSGRTSGQPFQCFTSRHECQYKSLLLIFLPRVCLASMGGRLRRKLQPERLIRMLRHDPAQPQLTHSVTHSLSLSLPPSPRVASNPQASVLGTQSIIRVGHDGPYCDHQLWHAPDLFVLSR